MSGARDRSIVLIGGDLSGGGGVNRIIRDLSDVFAAALGLRTVILSGRGLAQPTYRLSPSVTVESHPSGKSLWGYMKVIWSLRRRRFDFVIGFWPHDNILLAVLLWMSGSKVIVTEHVSWHFSPKPVQWLRRIAYRFAWRVIVLNEAELHYYQGFLGNVHLLPNIVPESPGCRSHTPRKKLVLAVGHLESRKNFKDAIRAMAEAGLEVEGWSLAIIGEGPEKSELESLIADLGLIRTAVHPPTSAIEQWYARASLLMVTSRLEVFSLVTVEAINGGVVPLAYAADGPSFILRDFPEQLVPVGDVVGLAARLRALAREPQLGELASSIRSAVSVRFSSQTIGNEWRDLLG